MGSSPVLCYPSEDANMVVDEDADREGESSDDLYINGDADQSTAEDLDDALVVST